MAIMITVEYILAQGKISTIGIKSVSGNDEEEKKLVLFPSTDNFPTLNNPLWNIKNSGEKSVNEETPSLRITL